MQFPGPVYFKDPEAERFFVWGPQEYFEPANALDVSTGRDFAEFLDRRLTEEALLASPGGGGRFLLGSS